jgi:hypothetical protein
MDGNYMLELNDEILIEANAVAELERQRIIKLLIDKAIEWRTADLHQQANYLDFAIQLIKGEQE